MAVDAARVWRADRSTWLAVPVVLAAGTVLAQVLYPLLGGTARDQLSVVIVVLFAAASVSHAAATGGWAVATAFGLATVAFGFGAEMLGVHTGVPFGTYEYSATLGTRVVGVPIVIALAWTMFAWPSALVARRLADGFANRVLIGAWALASWDLFLDPQMVAAGHWQWRYPSPHLPGVPTVPLTNYLGWLLVSILISLCVQGILAGLGGRPRPTATADHVPLALFGWTYLSSVLALAVFLHLGAAAAWGALGMGLVAVPLAITVRAGARAPEPA